MAYHSFKDTVAAIQGRGVSSREANAIAANQMRAKYSKAAIVHAQQTGTSLRGKPTKKVKKHPQHAAIMRFMRSNGG